MTHAVIFEKSGSHEIVGFQTEGHAGYADAGSDIVCAAISVLVINAINSVQVLLQSLVLGLSGVAEGNADYLSITFKEV